MSLSMLFSFRIIYSKQVIVQEESGNHVVQKYIQKY